MGNFGERDHDEQSGEEQQVAIVRMIQNQTSRIDGVLGDLVAV